MEAFSKYHIDRRSSILIKLIYRNITTFARLHQTTETFITNRERGKQEKTQLPLLFITLLALCITINWEDIGKNIDGEKLDQLRFSYNILEAQKCFISSVENYC